MRDRGGWEEGRGQNIGGCRAVLGARDMSKVEGGRGRETEVVMWGGGAGDRRRLI